MTSTSGKNNDNINDNNNNVADNDQQLSLVIIPRKIVTYPVGSDPKCGAVYFFGESNAPNLALLCAGYPDDHEIFVPFASRLAKEINGLVGVTCLPGYDDRDDHPYTCNKNEGYTMEEVVSAMREAFKVLKSESTFQGQQQQQQQEQEQQPPQLVGIFHDWGVFPGCTFTNRIIAEDNKELSPNKIILFDVMGPPHPETKDMPIVPKPTLLELTIEFTYRFVFASAFGIRRYVSKTLAQVFAGISLVGLSLTGLAPTYEIDNRVIESPRRKKKPLVLDRLLYMAYPYFNMFQEIFFGNPKKTFCDFCLPKNLEMTPTLYLYGTHKKIMFHDQRSIKVLEREEKEGRKSKVVAVNDAGHYLYVQQPEICMEEVKKFIMDA